MENSKSSKMEKVLEAKFLELFPEKKEREKIAEMTAEERRQTIKKRLIEDAVKKGLSEADFDTEKAKFFTVKIDGNSLSVSQTSKLGRAIDLLEQTALKYKKPEKEKSKLEKKVSQDPIKDENKPREKFNLYFTFNNEIHNIIKNPNISPKDKMNMLKDLIKEQLLMQGLSNAEINSSPSNINIVGTATNAMLFNSRSSGMTECLASFYYGYFMNRKTAKEIEKIKKQQKAAIMDILDDPIQFIDDIRESLGYKRMLGEDKDGVLKALKVGSGSYDLSIDEIYETNFNEAESKDKPVHHEALASEGPIGINFEFAKLTPQRGPFKPVQFNSTSKEFTFVNESTKKTILQAFEKLEKRKANKKPKTKVVEKSNDVVIDKAYYDQSRVKPTDFETTVIQESHTDKKTGEGTISTTYTAKGYVNADISQYLQEAATYNEMLNKHNAKTTLEMSEKLKPIENEYSANYDMIIDVPTGMGSFDFTDPNNKTQYSLSEGNNKAEYQDFDKVLPEQKTEGDNIKYDNKNNDTHNLSDAVVVEESKSGKKAENSKISAEYNITGFANTTNFETPKFDKEIKFEMNMSEPIFMSPPQNYSTDYNMSFSADINGLNNFGMEVNYSATTNNDDYLNAKEEKVEKRDEAVVDFETFKKQKEAQKAQNKKPENKLKLANFKTINKLSNVSNQILQNQKISALSAEAKQELAKITKFKDLDVNSILEKEGVSPDERNSLITSNISKTITNKTPVNKIKKLKDIENDKDLENINNFKEK